MQADDAHAGCRRAADVDHVAIGRAVDGYNIRRAIAGRGAERGAESTNAMLDTVVPERSLIVISIRAAQSVEGDAFDAVAIHDDVERRSRVNRRRWAVCRRNVDALGDIRAVEQHGVVAATAFNHVAAVAGIPRENVIAGAAEQNVRAGAADVSMSPSGCR